MRSGRLLGTLDETDQSSGWGACGRAEAVRGWPRHGRRRRARFRFCRERFRGLGDVGVVAASGGADVAVVGDEVVVDRSRPI